MKTKMKANHALSGLITGLLLLAAGTTTSHASLVLKFDAANYNPTTNVWADTSGNANNAVGPGPANSPTLTLNATPTGQSAVTFVQGYEYLDLTTNLNNAALTSSPSFSLFAVARKVDASYGLLLSGNGNGGAEGIGYRLDGGNGNRQTLTKNNVVDIGTSASATASGDFHLFGVTYDGTTARFFLDGVADGTAVNSQTFNTGIFHIGIQAGTGAGGFSGDIAALRVYDTVLSGAALTGVENSLITTFTAVPEPGTTLFGFACVGVAAFRRRRNSAV